MSTSAYIARRVAMLDEVRGLLISHLQLDMEPDQIDPDVALFGSGLGLDSVDVIELIVAVESHFGVDFPDDSQGGAAAAELQRNFRSVLRSLNTLVDFVMEFPVSGETPQSQEQEP